MSKKKMFSELASLLDEKSSIEERLKVIYERIHKLEQKIIEKFGEGSHVTTEFVTNVEQIVSKGRSSTAWKAVAEGIRTAVLKFRDSFLKSDKYDHKTAERYCSRLLSEYDDLKYNNTKEPKETISYKVEIKKRS